MTPLKQITTFLPFSVALDQLASPTGRQPGQIIRPKVRISLEYFQLSANYLRRINLIEMLIVEKLVSCSLVAFRQRTSDKRFNCNSCAQSLAERLAKLR